MRAGIQSLLLGACLIAPAPWDYYKVLTHIKGADAFGPPNPECSLVKK